MKHINTNISQQAGSKFPSSGYEVVNNRVLPIGEMTAADVGGKIAAHCKGVRLVKVLVFSGTIEEMNKRVAAMVSSGGKLNLCDQFRFHITLAIIIKINFITFVYCAKYFIIPR